MDQYSREFIAEKARLRPEDLGLVRTARRSHNQLGLAYQIAFIRLTGRAPGQQPFEILEDLVVYVSCEAKGLAYKFARFWALPLVGKRCPGPRSSLLDALTGLLAELEAFLARRIGVVQLLARDEEPAQRPPEAPDGTSRVLVVLSDVGFRLCHGNVVSPPSEAPGSRSVAPGRSWGYSTRRCGPVVGAIAGFDGERIKTPLAVA